MSYCRITPTEREQIAQMLTLTMSLTAIATSLGRHKSSIAREVARSQKQAGVYSAFEAQADAARKASARRAQRKLQRSPELWAIVKQRLGKHWSPEQIAAFLKQQYPEDRSMQISHEAIYTYLYVLPRGALKKELIGYLRQKRPTRRSRTSVHTTRGIIDMISIEERPAEVADRSIPGHWEGDLIMGAANRTAMGTLVERTTRAVILVPLTKKDAASVRRAFAREIKTLPEALRRSMTYDQGREMAEHKLFTAQTKMIVYFAHPHSPWERGTNENTNGLLRDYFPKGTDFSTISRKQIKRVQHELNERPRKTLDWQTPKQAMARLLSSSAFQGTIL